MYRERESERENVDLTSVDVLRRAFCVRTTQLVSRSVSMTFSNVTFDTFSSSSTDQDSFDLRTMMMLRLDPSNDNRIDSV
jgi:hypothetical protein